MSRISLYIPLGVFAAILGLGYVGFDLGARNELPSALINKPFPAFQARLLDSPETTLTREDLLGRPTLINVWATWCPTCLSEHEQLMQIAASTDVVIVGVNYKDQPNKAKQWLAQYGNPSRWVLLDAQGDVIYKRVGDINPRIWRDELAPRFRQLGIAMAMGNTDVGANK
jgi:cytochrome c biogenesis protein CcmG/thiol:disulfide interchange protein DsbE